jgi:alpha-1,3-rhamnosyl/mannosyltransferase
LVGSIDQIEQITAIFGRIGKMKKIYIDGLGLVEGHFSGIGQYILGIIRGLDEIIEESLLTENTVPVVTVIIPRGTVARFQSFGFKHIRYKTLPLPFRYVAALWHRGRMFPLDLWCGRGTYIFPRFVSMPLLFSPSALVIFDLSFELFRQYSDERNAIFLSQGVKRSLKTSQKVITISENAKKEILAFYNLAEHDVVVATPAVDPTYLYRRSQTEIDRVKNKYGIEGSYILALSNLEPRKNLEGLIDAYCALPRRIRNKTGLLLVGVSGWKIENLFEKIVARVGEGYNIMRPSQYVSDEDKPAIISGAELLVYPSHYEGFGMPPLEALSCGVPVITSNNSSLPEVVSGIGAMIESTDTDALTSAIVSALEDENLAQKMQTAGPAQAAKFSWKASAQKYLDVAKEIEG